jgi:1,6-anhydro-N-acetylmuramate kinase
MSTDRQILLDPTAEAAPAQRPRIARPASLDGLTIALLDINKPRGSEFLDRLEQRLHEHGLKTKRYTKERFSKVAAAELKQQISVECAAAVEALAD